MPTVISRTTLQGSIGTALRPRATVRDRLTRAAKDLSAYSVSFGIKTSADETSTYLISPVAGTGDSSGHLDATVSDTAMEAVPAGDCVGEFTASLSGQVEIRIQIPIQVVGRVIV